MAQRDLWSFCLFYSVTFGGYVGLTSFLPLLLRDQYGIAALTAGNVTALVALAGSVSRPFGGWVADRIGGVRVLMFALGGISIVYATMSRLPPPAITIPVLFLGMCCLGLGNGAVFQLVPQRFQREIGTATGVIGAVGGLGGFFLPTLLGAVKQATGSYARRLRGDGDGGRLRHPLAATLCENPLEGGGIYSSVMGFAPEYVTHVLNENFEDAKALFLGPLLSIHYAHLVMLAERGIVSREDARTIRAALDTIKVEDVRAVRYDGSCEDLFFYLDQVIAKAAGADVGGRLHTARSRNDIDMTMYRMFQREDVLGMLRATLALRDTFLQIASAHRDTIFPAHDPHAAGAAVDARALSAGASIEQLERDAVRLRAAFQTTNLNPLGACAITGTGFPIDRARTSELLGFDGPTGNTYGSIATIDYLLENLSATAVAISGVGRVVQDLLLWCTAEVGYLRLSDGYVQCSSIMPQKRNPVALEHARSIGSRALGQCQAVMLASHNTPFGDIVDTEDDLQPLVHSAFRDATRAVALVAAAMRDAQFDVEKMRARAEGNFITVTELADTLVREQGLPFSRTHAIASRLIAKIRQNPDGAVSPMLADVSKDVTGRAIVYPEDQLRKILEPRALRRDSQDARRTVAGSDRGRHRGVARDAGPGSRLAEGTRRRAGRVRAEATSGGRPAVTDTSAEDTRRMAPIYIAVIVLEVVTLLAVWWFQEYFG